MLSALQQFILRDLLSTRRTAPDQFLKFYAHSTGMPSRADQQTSVARSIERLVERGYCTTAGRKTKEKWFIERVELTPEGRKTARALLKDRQLTLYPRNKKIWQSRKK